MPELTTGGNDEQEILTGVELLPPRTGQAGFQTLKVTYADEWKLDAYDVYVRVNNGNPVYFSQGVWTTLNPVPLPPANNSPGVSDNNPAVPNPTDPNQDPNSVWLSKGTDLATGKPDWSIRYTTFGPADNSTFEIVGGWVWGHEQDITPPQPEDNNQATLYYTFPIPAGVDVNITMFMSDGDSCGDFAFASWTLRNVGQPNPGQQTVGAVHLVQ